MIRITVELLPGGIERLKRTLTVAHITNNGTGSNSWGNYSYQLEVQRGKGESHRTWKQGTVTGFPRKGRNVWHLIRKVMNHAFNS